MLTDPNAYGGLLVSALVISETASWGSAPLFGRLAVWINRATLAAGIVFTFSRSAWVALTLALLLLLAVRPRTVARLVFACLLGVPLFVITMGMRFVPIFQEMASRPKQVQGRFDLIDQALDAFSQHPIFGGGLGSFRLGAARWRTTAPCGSSPTSESLD